VGGSTRTEEDEAARDEEDDRCDVEVVGRIAEPCEREEKGESAFGSSSPASSRSARVRERRTHAAATWARASSAP